MRIVALVLVVALAGAGYYLLTPEGRQLVDRVRINMTRAEYQALLPRRQAAPRHARPRPLDERLAAHGVALGVPIYIRIFKLESELELWVEKDGRFVRFATYPICLWSGRLGPKLQGRRPPGARGLLYGRRRAAQSEQPHGTAPSISAFPTRSTRRMGAPAPSSWCMAAAPRSAATP